MELFFSNCVYLGDLRRRDQYLWLMTKAAGRGKAGLNGAGFFLYENEKKIREHKSKILGLE